jgi:hypothetical protein
VSRYDLSKISVERGKFLLAEDDLVRKEQLVARQKTDMALHRLHKEKSNARTAELNRRNAEK